MGYRIALLLGLIVTFAASLQAAEQKELEALLKREIIGADLPLAEVQRYCEDRVPQMPRVQSAAEWEAEAAWLRAAVLERIVYHGRAAKWREAPAKVEWLKAIEGGPGYQIKKLRFEALPGLWIPALLYQPEKLSGKVPAVLNVNGHVGAPGKAYIPKQIRCINQAKRGMLALNLEWLGMGQLGTSGFAHGLMNQLDLCGTSGLAPFYLCMKRGLDVLLGLKHVDPNRVAVTGLSGGGWQTI
ncbi:MAG: alpha/beta hydrolase family protein, partial [Planctomycetota bacterium]